MNILNVGSINIDHVYEVEHFVRPGETLRGLAYNVFAGGKGFNQSVALARAGARPLHAGRVGRDAGWLLRRLEQEGVDTTQVSIDEGATGHAIIQDPGSATVLTLGGKGALYSDAATRTHEPAPAVTAVDTTAAGDTFIGFFLAEMMRSGDPALALVQGCRAAAICVTRAGASDSIPTRAELESRRIP